MNTVGASNHQTIESRVVDIIARQAMVGAQQLGVKSEIAALGLDSLGLVEVIFALEQAFDIQIPFNANDRRDDQSALKTVGSVVEMIIALLAQKNGSQDQ